MYTFDVKRTKEQLLEWIKSWYAENANGCNIIVQASGGTDSFICASLFVEALGKEHVIMIGMPNGNQSLNEADEQAKWLGVRYMTVPITNVSNAVKQTINDVDEFTEDVTLQSEQNLDPRIRMMLAYYISQSLNGRVSGHCNLSERYIGYETRWGDSASDFAPLHNLTKTEVREIGMYMNLPEKWVMKTPDDGLYGSMSDEDKFGFTYKELDDYIRDGVEPEGYCHNNPNEELKIDKIKRMHKQNLFKMKDIASFVYY